MANAYVQSVNLCWKQEKGVKGTRFSAFDILSKEQQGVPVKRQGRSTSWANIDLSYQ